jgi:sulfate permease, SulP family
MMKANPAKKSNLASDLVAGVVGGVANIPDGLASAILAGANPAYGLYAVMIGTPVGALLSSSVFMTIVNTSALSITTGAALAGFDAASYPQALFTLTLLTGVIMLLAGLLRLGRLTRFISHSVMIGFLTGISALVVLSQLGDFTGYASEYSNKVIKAVDLLLHLNQVDLHTTIIGFLTVALILGFDRTRLRNFSMLLGILLASAATLVLGWDTVQLVGDVAEIPKGLPSLSLPDLGMVPSLLIPAFSLAIIGLVQGAGISKGYPNPDGRYPKISRDFIGQGAANLATGLFQGMPVAGGMGNTAVNVGAGARSRWSNVFSGLVVMVAVLLFSKYVSLLAMPAMAALLILAGIQSIKAAEVVDVWQVGVRASLIMLVTFVCTLAMPVQYAVFVGVALSALAYFITSAYQVRLVELVPVAGSYREQPAPTRLPDKAVTILQAYGSLFYAAIDRLEEKLPSVRDAERPVVILRMRQHDEIGSTFIELIERYEAQLKAVGGKLILAGVNPKVMKQLKATETSQDILGDEDVFMATKIVRQSLDAAIAAAQAWLKSQAEGSESK